MNPYHLSLEKTAVKEFYDNKPQDQHHHSQWRPRGQMAIRILSLIPTITQLLGELDTTDYT